MVLTWMLLGFDVAEGEWLWTTEAARRNKQETDN